jgi:hypothetical protein
MGVGNNEAEVCDHVHGCTPDEGSNMLKAWRMFEGAGCVCHRAHNCLKAAVEGFPDSQLLFRKVNGIVAYFHRSTKVSSTWGCVSIDRHLTLLVCMLGLESHDATGW